jgi:hypothetical protein
MMAMISFAMVAEMSGLRCGGAMRGTAVVAELRGAVPPMSNRGELGEVFIVSC